MGKNKFYAVRKGHKSGIYMTWPACQIQIKGYASPEYKGFRTLEEAEYFLKEKNQENEQLFSEEKIAKAYVDGSYDSTTSHYAGGGVILYKDQEVHISKRGTDIELAKMRNVAGELLGAIEVMTWFEMNRKVFGLEKLMIYYDYEGIEKWATNQWRAKKEGTQAYVRKYKEFRQAFPISFVKVLAHSGDYYNEQADALAKQALGID